MFRRLRSVVRSAVDIAREELERRREEKRPIAPQPPVPKKREPAPVIVYFEKDRNQRELERIREVLEARSITPRMLDVAGDEPTIAFVMREAKCDRDHFPIVFVAAKPIGRYNDVVAADVSGELVKLVFGA